MSATHTDLRQMLSDMYEYSKTSSSSVILCNDDPRLMYVGFVVAIGELERREFSITVSNYNRCFSQLVPRIRKAINRSESRGSGRILSSKEFLERIFEPDLKRRKARVIKETKEIEKLRPIINSAFDRLEVI